MSRQDEYSVKDKGRLIFVLLVSLLDPTIKASCELLFAETINTIFLGCSDIQEAQMVSFSL
jgi:hypothetical protein